MNNLVVVIYALSTVALLILAFGSLYAGLKMRSVAVKTSLILVSILLLVTVILGTVGFVYYKNQGQSSANPVQTSSSVVYKYLQPNEYVNYWDIYDDNGWWWDRNPRRHTTNTTTNVNIHNHNKPTPNKPTRSTTTTSTSTTTTKFVPEPTLSRTTTTKPALLQTSSPSTTPELGILPAPLVNIPPNQIPMPSGMITAEKLMTDALRNAPISSPTVQSSLPFPPALPDGTPNITVNP
jgi:hypothetical protein